MVVIKCGEEIGQIVFECLTMIIKDERKEVVDDGQL